MFLESGDIFLRSLFSTGAADTYYCELLVLTVYRYIQLQEEYIKDEQRYAFHYSPLPQVLAMGPWKRKQYLTQHIS